MVLLENLRIALQSLIGNSLRSLLTLVGMAVGIGAVLYVVTLGAITQQRINSRLESLGSNVLSIQPGASHMRGLRTAENRVNLSWEESREIQAASRVIERVVPTHAGSASAEYRDQNTRTRATGTTADYFLVNNDSLVAGRFFAPHEVLRRARVAVIGDTVWEDLFQRADAVGETILINSQRFDVIGVLTPVVTSYFAHKHVTFREFRGGETN